MGRLGWSITCRVRSGGLLLEPAANLAEIGERGKVDGEVQPPRRLGPHGRGAGDAADGDLLQHAGCTSSC
jgi:hypothetical protein